MNHIIWVIYLQIWPQLWHDISPYILSRPKFDQKIWLYKIGFRKAENFLDHCRHDLLKTLPPCFWWDIIIIIIRYIGIIRGRPRSLGWLWNILSLRLLYHTLISYETQSFEFQGFELDPNLLLKSSSDSSHFMFEINVGKSRIRHRTTLNLDNVIFKRFWPT